MYIHELAKKSQKAFRLLKKADTNMKNNALSMIAKNLKANAHLIITENEKDLKAAKINGVSEPMLDRLMIDNKRINSMVDAIDSLIRFNDPIGEIVRGNRLNNGIEVKQVREPLGVIAMIFESRPNVTIDAAALAIKSGNTCILRGGKEALSTNKILVKIIRESIASYIPIDSVQLIERIEHQYVTDILHARGLIDLVIPRGSNRLIQTVINEARVPTIETGAGLCNTYVASSANIEKALAIIINAKASRPSVCNSLENIVVDEKIAHKFLPVLHSELIKVGVEFRGDEKTCKIVDAIKTTDEDFDTEYLDYILSCKIVCGVDEAIEFINSHSTKHSEAIITENYSEATLFLDEIDSACVYVNASIRFSDGHEFGYGAEIGISTQKMHARGPVGLKELTTTKYKIYGDGQVR